MGLICHYFELEARQQISGWLWFRRPARAARKRITAQNAHNTHYILHFIFRRKTQDISIAAQFLSWIIITDRISAFTKSPRTFSASRVTPRSWPRLCFHANCAYFDHFVILRGAKVLEERYKLATMLKCPETDRYTGAILFTSGLNESYRRRLRLSDTMPYFRCKDLWISQHYIVFSFVIEPRENFSFLDAAPVWSATRSILRWLFSFRRDWQDIAFLEEKHGGCVLYWY